eukprot:c3759_g1_i1.p1 GENE.c3759_g1_i1~~c3759_g1_i1.p1  ORF type:complete len:151 (+),score=18.12 c3759_g1_i1:62-454(+)
MSYNRNPGNSCIGLKIPTVSFNANDWTGDRSQCGSELDMPDTHWDDHKGALKKSAYDGFLHSISTGDNQHRGLLLPQDYKFVSDAFAQAKSTRSAAKSANLTLGTCLVRVIYPGGLQSLGDQDISYLDDK